MPPRILLVDDSGSFRENLRSLLERNVDWEICGEESSGLEAVEVAPELRPDLIILDITLPDLGDSRPGN